MIQWQPGDVPPDLTELRELLSADRTRTRDLITALTHNFTSIVEATRLTATDDEHDPEGATIAFERSQTSALLAAATTHLADVDHALARITNNTYGHCEKCNSTISPNRLLARPAARTCITCAS